MNENRIVNKHPSYGEEQPVTKCPYCQSECDADFVDVGVGMIQCGPYHCFGCRASEIGPYDKKFDPFKRNFSDDDQLEITEPPSGVRVLTKRESEAGWYEPATPPGSSANVIGGQIVTHQTMREEYHNRFAGSPEWNSKKLVDDWWKQVREQGIVEEL